MEYADSVTRTRLEPGAKDWEVIDAMERAKVLLTVSTKALISLRLQKRTAKTRVLVKAEILPIGLGLTDAHSKRLLNKIKIPLLNLFALLYIH